MPSADVKKAILSEIEQSLGDENHKVTEARLEELERALTPTIASLPKNEKGNLGHAAVRYALHRLFVQRHGWFVRGLEPGGEAWNATSPVEALKGGVPEYIQGLFEDRLGLGGLGLHEVALLAAVLENMAHQEAVSRLQAAYESISLTRESTISVDRVDEVLDMYMVTYLLGADLSTMTPQKALAHLVSVGETYSGWEDTQAFVRGVRTATAGQQTSFAFQDVVNVVSEIGDRYGRWQDRECKDLKQQLLLIQDDGSGRVQLSKFYESAYHSGKWQFTESAAYLKELGALDESDPFDKKVIVPNYITSPSNCMASSSYYSVCCIDECEELIGHLEKELLAPDATAQEIGRLVAALPSASMAANRTLSPSLLKRLNEIAESHGGRVPLHGRLFAQWMHHAYARECPYPHVSGTTAPKRMEDYRVEGETDTHATKEEMLQFIEAPAKRAKAVEAAGITEEASEEGPAPWHHEEELLVPKKKSRTAVMIGTLRGMLPVGFAVAGLGSAAVLAVRTAKSSLAPVCRGEKLAKYCV